METLAANPRKPKRPWWGTSENLYDVCPYPTVDWLTMSKDDSFRPFVEWCAGEYMSLHEGRALLVALVDAPREEIESINLDLESEPGRVRWIAVPPKKLPQ
jgi:hypothetical protein